MSAHHLMKKVIASAVLFTLSATALVSPALAVQNTTTSYQYDAMGRVTQITDPLGHVTTQSYDPLGRLKQENLPAPVTGGTSPAVTFAYDGQDQLHTVTDPRSLVTTYTKDGLGNQSALSSPDTGSSSSTYDVAGNLKTSTDARGKVTTYTYDVLNRVTQISYTTGTATQFEYDGGTTGAANAKGHLTKMTDGSGTTTYSYDGFGHLLTKVQSVTGITGSRTLSYAYGTSGSTNGKLTSITYPSGNRINYTFDAAGRISNISLNPTNTNGTSTNTGSTIALLNTIGYQPFGLPVSWTWGNSTPSASSTYGRGIDLDGRISSLPLGNGVNNGLFRTITYDAGSRITGITHTGTGTGTFAPSLFAQSYTYDNQDHLKTVTGSSQQSYTYDANGNRTAATFGSSSYTNTVSTTSNRLSSTTGPSPAKTNVYDASGHVTGDGTTTYVYNDRGRRTSSTVAAGTFTYVHNGLEQRVKKSGPTAVIATGANSYVYDEQGHLIGEYDANNAMLEETVFLGDQPVAVLKQVVTGTGGSAVTATSVYNVFADQLNTPRVITRTSDNQIVWRWDYSNDPFGFVHPNDNPSGLGTFTYNQRFPGQLFDIETNTHYNINRDYDPQLGSYLQSDPIGLNGGLISTYSYVGGNPVSRFDPKGLYCVSNGGYTSCVVPDGPSFTVPTPSGFPGALGIGTPDPLYHKYDIARALNGADPDCVAKEMGNNPTPGKPNPATPDGTKNNAVVGGIDNIVTSYLTNDTVTGTPVEVNIAGTDDGSLFGPGYVARYVQGGVAHTVGEGSNWKQSPSVTGEALQNLANQALWGDQMSRIIKKCKCKK